MSLRSQDTFTVIVYRKNQLVTSLGYVQEAHDSTLSIKQFDTIDEVEAFLTQEHLNDLRRREVDPWSAMNQYTFLASGKISNHFFEAPLFTATLQAQHLFDTEMKAKREKERREQAERDARALAAKRERDISDLKRILKTYSVDELRNELAGELRV